MSEDLPDNMSEYVLEDLPGDKPPDVKIGPGYIDRTYVKMNLRTRVRVYARISVVFRQPFLRIMSSGSGEAERSFLNMFDSTLW